MNGKNHKYGLECCKRPTVFLIKTIINLYKIYLELECLFC